MDNSDSASGLRQRHALLAACSVLLVAYTNYSLLGLAFLLVFYAWGLAYLRPLLPSVAAKLKQSLWGLVSAGATALLAGQIVLQSIYAAGNASWATDPHTRRVLQLLGLQKAGSVSQIALVIAAPAIALLASTMELSASDTDARSRQGSAQQGSPSRQPRLDRSSMHSTLAESFGHDATRCSNARVACSVALCLSALAWPSLLALPYFLLLAALVIAWRQDRQRPFNSGCLRTLQVYAGVHTLVLYLWQIHLVRRVMWQGASSWLGLFQLHHLNALHQQPQHVLVCQVIQLVSLHLLFAATAFLAAGQELGRTLSASGAWQQQHTSPLETFAALWHGSQRHAEDSTALQDPLLGEGDPYGQPSPQSPGRHQAATPGTQANSLSRLLCLAIPSVAGLVLKRFEAACSQVLLPALALIGFALLQPSALSTAALLVGLLSLLSRKHSCEHLLTRTSPYLCTAVLLWQLACYLATALAPVVMLPALARSLGLLVYGQGGPALGFLLAQLGTALALAALARAPLHRREADWYNSSTEPQRATATGQASLHDSIANYWHHGRPHRSSTSGYAAQGTAHGSSSSSATSEGLRPVRTGVHHPAPSQAATASLDYSPQQYAVSPAPNSSTPTPRGPPWPALKLELARALHYTGFLVLPGLLFWVGLSSQDLLHGIYLALLLIYFLGSALGFEPHVRSGALKARQHWMARGFAALHMAALYLALLAWLPSMPSASLPRASKKPLQAVGLWQPHIAKDMLPVLLLFVAGTLHANLGQWLQQQQQQQPHDESLLVGPAGHPSLILTFGKASVSFGALIIVLAGYVLTLWACNIGLLGLGYLGLLIWVFTYPPIRGRWDSVDEGGVQVDPEASATASGGATANSMKGSSRLRWLPLAALALYAGLDAILQYSLAATQAASALHLSPKLVAILTDEIGFGAHAHGARLAVQLMRSLLLLALLHLYRFGFAVGTAQSHAEGRSSAPDTAGQEGLVPLMKRCFILHASKALGLAVFWAAMHHPGAIGWLLTLGLVCLGPLLGRSATAPHHQRRLLLAAMILLDAITAVWILAQYAFEVGWIRQRLGNDNVLVVRLIKWAGIQEVPCRAGPLEAALRSKCVLLLAVTLKRRAVRWLRKLPEEVRDAGGPGSPCCLFWPLAGSSSYHPGSTSGGRWRQVKGNPFVHYLDLAVQDTKAGFNRNLKRVLRAVDWPIAKTGKEARQQNGRRHDDEGTKHPDRPGSAEEEQGSSGQAGAGAGPGQGRPHKQGSTWQQQLRLFQLAAIDQTERLWQNWGLEIAMASLLVAAFLATNVLSLVYMVMIGAGMAAPEGPRRRAWRFLFVPLLALLLLLQYSVLIGPPPPLQRPSFMTTAAQPLLPEVAQLSANLPQLPLLHKHHKAKEQIEHQTFKAWLGLSFVDPAALWALFLAFAACAIQVHYDTWRHPADADRRASSSSSLVERLLPQSLQDAYADGRATVVARINVSERDESSGGVPPAEAIWMAMNFSAQPSWRWLDWARFYFYRHYTDAVLIAVIGLCALENDVIHAGYLALALYFFRYRERLRTPALFRWLPLYNFLVMLLCLAYQAPVQIIWHGTTHRKGCNLAHILGLYKMTGKSGLAFELTAAGSIADVVLWGIARLQMRMYASETFQRAMQVVADEQAASAAAAGRHTQAEKRQQVRAVLQASSLRAERATRVAKLKAGVSRSGGSFGVNSALLELDNEADDRDSERRLLGDRPDSADNLLQDQAAQEHAAASSGTDAHTGIGQLVSRSAESAAAAVASATDALQPNQDIAPEDTGHDPSISQDRPVMGDSQSRQQADSNQSSNSRSSGKSRILWRLVALLQRIDEESWTCYVLFVLIFVLDVSLLTMLFPISLAAYALAAQRPSPLYWQACLVYLEGILIAQYIFQIPTHLHCRAVSRSTEAYASILGLHRNVLSAVPLFLVYLATLMHVYALSRQQGQAVANGPSQASISPDQDLEAGSTESRQPGRESGSATTEGRLSRAWQGLFQSWQGLKGFLLAVCSARERPLHFIKVEVAPPQGSSASSQLDLQQAASLQASLQAIMDDYQAQDINAARQRLQTSHSQAQLQSEEEEEGNVLDHLTEPLSDQAFPKGTDLSRVGAIKVVLEEVLDEGRAGLLAAVLQVIPERASGPYDPALPMPVRSLRPAQDAASVLQRYKEDHPEARCSLSSSDPDGPSAPAPNADKAPADHGDSTLDQPPEHDQQGLFGTSPTSNSLSTQPSDQFADARSSPHASSASSDATLQTAASSAAVKPSQASSSITNSSANDRQEQEEGSKAEEAQTKPRGQRGPGLAGVLGSPSTSPQSRFARFASLKTFSSSSQEEAEPEQQGANPMPGTDARQQPSSSSSSAGGLQLGAVEPHWRTETDYYAATVALDFLSFAYVALFYQSVVSSAQSLSDITDERVVPVAYLATLILLFLFMVLDRLFYTLGLHLGKALLLWSQMGLFYYYTFSLFWSPFSSSAAHSHLRLLVLLKTCSFALSALQLRSGYPPRASFKGAGGRHAFVFMRHVNTWGYLGLQIFCGLPFIYELRAVLDWSCTPTTLKLFDWLKLEDISTSLFFVTCDRVGREGRALGQRQPRYMKFCQGALLFTLLLVLLWVPLIVFSSGNPTYRVPSVDGFALNVSIGSMPSAQEADFAAHMTFPLFVGGERRLQGKWVGNGTLPGGMPDQYTDDQLELLCVSESSDRLWRLTPPAQTALSALLDDSSAAMSFSWSVLRNAPPSSPHGSPMCQATRTFPLAPQSRRHLVDILQGTRDTAELMVANTTNATGHTSRGLYSLFWQLRGDMCAVKVDFRYQSPGWGRGGSQEQWDNQHVGCNISLATTSNQDKWWQLQCQVLDDEDQPVDNSLKGWATCASSKFNGPRLVAVLERVQTGFLGQTLSSFGITGLYITFVFGIGRFLRLAATNIRMRIMYEDLPTTKRLIALCQDIYIARAQGELALEEELYWALINIYRSPAVMFELTKKKEQ